jgi:putative flavoprotein involved in K+ transport
MVEQLTDEPEVLVIGAGAAGLSVAGELERCAVPSLLIDRAERIGTPWETRYEGLRLNTVRQLSVPRGAALPPSAGRWVRPSALVACLRRYAAEHQLEIRFGVEAERIDHDGDRWLVNTSIGPIDAQAVVVATGYDCMPRTPDWFDPAAFSGTLIHSADYRRPSDFAGADVLVVGPGNSGCEIATELAAGSAARVRLSVRTGPNLMPSTFLGIPATWLARANEDGPRAAVDLGARLIQRLSFGDLTRYGLQPSPVGVATELGRGGHGPVLERGFLAKLERGDIEIVPAVERLCGEEVLLAGGECIRPDAVIAATGFGHGLDRLVGHLDVLDDAGRPHEVRGQAASPGLYFNGFWLPLSGQLPAMRRTSRRIARAIVKARSPRRATTHRRNELV